MGKKFGAESTFGISRELPIRAGALRLLDGSEDRTASDFHCTRGIARPGAKAKKAAPEFRGRQGKPRGGLESYLRVDLQDAPIQRHSEERTIRVGVGPDGGLNFPKDRAPDAILRQIEILVVENIKRSCSNREA